MAIDPINTTNEVSPTQEMNMQSTVDWRADQQTIRDILGNAGYDVDQLAHNILDVADQNGGINPGKTQDERMEYGVFSARNRVLAEIVWDSSKSALENLQTAAQFKNAAMAGDVDTIAQLMQDRPDVGLSPDDVMRLLQIDEYHSSSGGLGPHDGGGIKNEEDVFRLNHLFSLNWNDQMGNEPGTIGGYNHQGDYPQWGEGGNGSGFSDLLTDELRSAIPLNRSE